MLIKWWDGSYGLESVFRNFGLCKILFLLRIPRPSPLPPFQCMILWYWIYVIKHLSPIECTTARVNPNIKYGLWLITTHTCRLTSCHKSTALCRTLTGGGCVCRGQGAYGNSVYFLLNFAVNLQLLICLNWKVHLFKLSKINSNFSPKLAWSLVLNWCYHVIMQTSKRHCKMQLDVSDRW